MPSAAAGNTETCLRSRDPVEWGRFVPLVLARLQAGSIYCYRVPRTTTTPIFDLPR